MNSEYTDELDLSIKSQSTCIKDKEEIMDDYVITLQNASFSWDHRLKEHQIEHLKSINLMVPKGSVTLVLGEVCPAFIFWNVSFHCMDFIAMFVTQSGTKEGFNQQ